MEMNMATPNDYGMMWMSPSHMLLPQSQGDAQQIPSEMLHMDAVTTHLENPYYPLAIPPSFEALGDQSLRIDNFMMMDDFEAEYCDEPPKFSSAATQTSTNSARKIKPVKHPGLKLQTPIAYKCDTDPSMIPIQKDGMAICEKCGAIGVKHSFYTRHRNYCSMACARGSLFTDMKEEPSDGNENSQELDDSNFKFPNGVGVEDEELMTGETMPMSLGPPKLDSIPSNPSATVSRFPFPKLELPVEDPVLPSHSKKSKLELAGSYSWDSQLAEPGFIAVPVSCFKHAPMAECWDNITVGMKVEVENRDCEDYSEAFSDSFWVATVLRIAGYKALLRYEGFGQNNDKDFWVNLCCNNVHPVGWCATRGKPLIPPKTIEEKYKDWKDFLVKRLTGARTLPTNFCSKINDSLKSRFRVGMNVEVVDKNRISQVCVATVKRIVGKRLHVEYYNAEDDDNGFWCHEDSPLLHPVGWASRVGHLIDAPEDYIERCESGVIEKDDATDELFTAPQQSNVSISRVSSAMGKFQEGMKLEAIDPLNLSSICVATVMKVLRDGYLMIRIDSYPPDVTGSDWFCYHSSSPHIFPPGFCHQNSVPLIPPKDYDKSEFNWDTYVKETSAILAPTSLFEKPIPSHGFVVGMRLEAADLMDPRLVCVGTVSRVVGRLLKIHFDGWEEEYDQWLDCESPDVYPVGWCNLVSHKLEGPRCMPGVKSSASFLTKKRQRKRIKTRQKNASPNKKPYPYTEDEESYSASGSVNMEIKQESDLSQDDGSCFSVAMNSTFPDGRVTETKEPETGREPSGPDQSLPVSAAPRTQHTAHSSFAESSSFSYNTKYIPRLTDSSAPTNSVETGILNPKEWEVGDVEKFLKMNECSAYAENFLKQGIDGKSLLQLTKDNIMDVIGFKIGPTLKIYDLIQQLKIKANKANFKKIV